MEQRVSLITLGVGDLARARAFYERLGWHGQEVEETVFFQARSVAIVLWGRDKLALDCGIADRQSGGFEGWLSLTTCGPRPRWTRFSQRLSERAAP